MKTRASSDTLGRLVKRGEVGIVQAAKALEPSWFVL